MRRRRRSALDGRRKKRKDAGKREEKGIRIEGSEDAPGITNAPSLFLTCGWPACSALSHAPSLVFLLPPLSPSLSSCLLFLFLLSRASAPPEPQPKRHKNNTDVCHGLDQYPDTSQPFFGCAS